ncbi:MAG: hypothetical protein HDT46_06315 [Ruminococcaceae bacterium]|nr:hypothetical protein [Oscillospiraceae bacterium]
MINGKLQKLTAGILAAAVIFTACTAVNLYADCEYKEENIPNIVSEEDGDETDPTSQEIPEPEPEPEDTTESSSEEETEPITEDTEPVTEETINTPSESEPPMPDETTAVSTTYPTGGFVVPTEPPSTAAPIIIILIGPGYVPPDDTTTTTRPVPPDVLTFETPEQTDSPNIIPTVNKYIRASENVPSFKISMDGEELLNAVVDPFEKAWLSDDVDVILSVNNGDNLSDSDKELIKAAAYDTDSNVKYSVGQYLDISLLANINGEERNISEAYKEIPLTFEIPQNIKDSSYAYGLIRVHNGTAELLKDLDSDPDTITVKTDCFSACAIVYTKDIDDINIKTANMLDCLRVFLPVTSIAVLLCSFVTLYALWNKKNGKRSKK